jgi:hypothetical protein
LPDAIIGGVQPNHGNIISYSKLEPYTASNSGNIALTYIYEDATNSNSHDDPDGSAAIADGSSYKHSHRSFQSSS